MHSITVAALAVLTTLTKPSQACVSHMMGHHHLNESTYEHDLERQTRTNPRILPPSYRKKTALSNVRVWNGYEIEAPSTIFFEGDIIVEDAHNVDIFLDGKGGILLPGLFDSHAHAHYIDHLEALSGYGVTTVMNMACQDYAQCAGLRNQIGLTSFFTAGWPAHGTDSPHARAQKDTPDRLINHPREAPQWVENVFGNGSDYLKITAEKNGPNQATQDAIVALAHAKGKKVMTHAAEYPYYKQAILSKADNPQHIPMDAVLTDSDLEMMKEQNMFATPTVHLYKVVLKKLGVLQPEAARGINFTQAYGIVQENVRRLHAAGIPVLAGTDSTKGDYPITLPFGDFLHSELEDFVELGLSPADTLRSATIIPATQHNLLDRGSIQPGLRADLVLLKPHANPLHDIRDTRKIARVWNGGVEFKHIHPNNMVAQKAEQGWQWVNGVFETAVALCVVGVASVFGRQAVGKAKLF